MDHGPRHGQLRAAVERVIRLRVVLHLLRTSSEGGEILGPHVAKTVHVQGRRGDSVPNFVWRPRPEARRGPVAFHEEVCLGEEVESG